MTIFSFFSRNKRRESLTQLRRLSKELAEENVLKRNQANIRNAFQQLIEGIFVSRTEQARAFYKYFIIAEKRRVLQQLEEEAALLAHIPDESKISNDLERELKINERLSKVYLEKLDDRELHLSEKKKKQLTKKYHNCLLRMSDIKGWIVQKSEEKSYAGRREKLIELYNAEKKPDGYDILQPDSENLRLVSSEASSIYAGKSRLFSEKFYLEKPQPILKPNEYVRPLKIKSRIFQKNIYLQGIKYSFRRRFFQFFRPSFDPHRLITNIFNLADQMRLREKNIFMLQEIDQFQRTRIYNEGLSNCLRTLSNHKLLKLCNHLHSPGFKNLLAAVEYFIQHPDEITCKDHEMVKDAIELKLHLRTKILGNLQNYLLNTQMMIDNTLDERGLKFKDKDVYMPVFESKDQVASKITEAITKYLNAELPEATDQFKKDTETSIEKEIEKLERLIKIPDHEKDISTLVDEGNLCNNLFKYYEEILKVSDPENHAKIEENRANYLTRKTAIEELIKIRREEQTEMLRNNISVLVPG